MIGWSRIPPKEDGFYWLRRHRYPDTIVKLYDSSSGLKEFVAMVSWSGGDWDSSLCEVIQEDKCRWQLIASPKEG